MEYAENFLRKQNAKILKQNNLLSDNTTVINQINLAKENNQNAFSFLLNLYWDDVYKFQLKRSNNEADAEDITIESFAKAFEKIKTYNQKYVFKTWLITISKNLHIDQLRKNKNRFDLNHLNENIQIKENSPTAISLGLEAYDNLYNTNNEHEYLSEMLNKMQQNDDAKEGLSAFKEKRKPNWTGN